MEAFLVSAGAVAISEIADKTQLLALVLAARFRRPLPIVLGILVATLANHAVAGAVGNTIPGLMGDTFLRLALGLSFLAMSAWALLPDRLDQGPKGSSCARGAFITSLIAFFLAEIGDKTQVATVALAAVYPSLPAVVLGTTLGMMAVNTPVVLFGEGLARVVPLRAVRFIAAAIYAVLGTMALLGFGA